MFAINKVFSNSADCLELYGRVEKWLATNSFEQITRSNAYRPGGLFPTDKWNSEVEWQLHVDIYEMLTKRKCISDSIVFCSGVGWHLILSANPFNTSFEGEFELIVHIADEQQAILCKLATS
jgi:hypothetical protein